MGSFRVSHEVCAPVREALLLNSLLQTTILNLKQLLHGFRQLVLLAQQLLGFFFAPLLSAAAPASEEWEDSSQWKVI